MLALGSQVDKTQDSALQALLADCMADTSVFAKTFMPQAFDKPFTAHHRAAWKLMDDHRLPRVAVCGYRGLGKSTMVMTKIVKSICFRQNRHIVYVGQNQDFAKKMVDNIKMELVTNPLIRDVFGNMKATSFDGVDLSFNKVGFFLSDPNTGAPITFVSALGLQQSPRGMNVRINGAYVRPDFLGGDDLESDEDVANGETREKIWLWLNTALKYFVPEERPNPVTGMWDVPEDKPFFSPPWRMFFMDTYKHEAAAMARMLQSPDWNSLRLPQAEPIMSTDEKITGFTSLVPEVITDAQVMAEYEESKRDGTSDGWFREKLCLPTSQENRVFRASYFKYFREEDFGNRIQRTGLSYDLNVHKFLIVDPARTSNPKSAHSAILGVGVNPVEQKIFNRDLIDRCMDPLELIQGIIEMCFALNTRVVFFEKTGLEDWGDALITNECAARGIKLDIRYIDARSRVGMEGDYGTGKDAPKRARAGQIQPYYQKGCVYHAEHLRQSALEQQMLDYPGCVRWDAIDCAGYIPKCMHDMGIFWKPVKRSDRESRGWVFDDNGRGDELGDRIRSGEWMTCS